MGVCSAAFTVDANESFVAEDSGLIVIGFDKGEGLAILLEASEEEARGGIFTSRGWSCFSGVCSAITEKELALAAVEEDGAGFAVDIDPLASRLEA